MTIVIAFANQKGGVGKSTLTTQLAYFLSLRKGKSVLLIDMDAQASASTTLLDGGEYSGTPVEDVFDDEVEDIQIQSTEHGVDLLGSTPSPSAYDVDALPLEQVFNPKKHLKDTLKRYDYVLIDCPPSLGRRLVSALVLADCVVSPIKLSGYAVAGLTSLLQTVEEIKKNANRQLRFLGVAVNDYMGDSGQRDALEGVTQAVGNILFETKIRHRAPIDQASNGRPITAVRNSAKANEELTALFEEILNRAEGNS